MTDAPAFAARPAQSTAATGAAPVAAPVALRRPRLLARAARAGARLYRRERDLPGLAGELSARDRLPRLAALEAACEEARRAGAAGYSVARHVALLAALIAERTAGARAA